MLFFVKADFGIILVFIIGIILGLLYQFFYKKNSQRSDKLIPTINAQQYFNEIEISIFSKILTSPDKSISSHELTLIINQKNLSSVELNRLKRLILKDLNLKIKIVFGISNGIWQVDSFEDKKLEKFMLSKKFNVSQLNKIFLS
jgi:hypothetical protein